MLPRVCCSKRLVRRYRELLHTRQMAKIVKISYEDQESIKSAAVEAARVLERGGVVALPTDTIYGIACSTQCSEAIQRIYSIKGRQAAKPLAICVGGALDVDRWAINTVDTALLSSLLPGPVTLVLKRRESLNPSLNPGRETVGVRVPDHAFTLQLMKEFSGAIALTSANISNQQSTLCVEEFESLWSQLDLVVDGGTISDVARGVATRSGSTVVDLSTPGHYSIIRPGCACNDTVSELEKFGLT